MNLASPETRADASSPTPRFARPPVVEVAISVQFDELRRFGLVDFGLLWERLRDRFPDAEHQPPLLPVVELFDGRSTRTGELRLEPAFPIGRCWYRSADRRRLIQVQPDRFVLNWQKADAGSAYPSYETLREEFRQDLRGFVDFVAQRQLGDFEPTQCELIYVNHLLAGREWNHPRDLYQVLAPLSGAAHSSSLPEPEDFRFGWQYRFDGERGPLGRMHVQLYSAVRDADARSVFVLQIVGRGAPLGADVDGVLAFTDRAHEWITHGFADMTTKRMHQLWERER